jgi:hypothetical protein
VARGRFAAGRAGATGWVGRAAVIAAVGTAAEAATRANIMIVVGRVMIAGTVALIVAVVLAVAGLSSCVCAGRHCDGVPPSSQLSVWWIPKY